MNALLKYKSKTIFNNSQTLKYINYTLETYMVESINNALVLH